MTGLPKAPPGLLKAAQDRWTAFWSSPVAGLVDQRCDLPRLTRWIAATDEYDRIAKVCKGARLVKGSTGQPVLNPLLAYLAQLDVQISRAETEFGMTPMARLRFDVAPPAAEQGDEIDELRARRAARRADRGAEPSGSVGT